MHVATRINDIIALARQEALAAAAAPPEPAPSQASPRPFPPPSNNEAEKLNVSESSVATR